MDWLNLFYHFLWLLGLALLLTTLSLVRWWAGQEEKPFQQGLAGPPARLALAAGFCLVALGLALLVEPWTYKAGWVGLMGLAGWVGLAAWREQTN